MSDGHLITFAELKALNRDHHRLAMLTGRTPMFACQADPRFSYCLYVPQDIGPAERQPLAVVVHGDRRTAERYRDALTDFAEAHRCVVLAPLFPAGISGPNDMYNYKLLRHRGIRFDQILLEIVAEVGVRWPVKTDKFYLHGYSGGGQFALRFFYVNADRLAGVSIGAPSRVTMISQGDPWPVGTADLATEFDVEPRPDAMRAVPVQLFIGERDTKPRTWSNAGHRRKPGEPRDTRIDRITALRDNLLENGIRATLDIVPEVAHDGMALLPTATRFLGNLLQATGKNPRTYTTTT